MLTPHLPSLRVQFVALLGMVLTAYLILVSYPQIQRYAPCLVIGGTQYNDGRKCWNVVPQHREVCESPCTPIFYRECKPVAVQYESMCYNGTQLTIVPIEDYFIELVIVVSIIFGYLTLSAALLRSHWFRPPYETIHHHSV